MEEQFDVVSEDDEVIGRCTRKEAHTRGHIHRSVLFFILDKDHRVFLNQRTESKEFYPGYWSIVFGGHVHAGESYEETVIREAKEEAGIDDQPLFVTSFKKRFDREDKENVRVYAIVTDKKLSIDPEEIKQGVFATVEEINNKMKKDNFLPETSPLFDVLKRYLRSIN